MDKIVKLKPVVKSYIWGGKYFQPYFHRDEEKISELWVLSARENNSAIIDSGIDKGKPLNEVIDDRDLGPIQDRFSYFPLLIKLIDAQDNLSVQVHPNDEYALKNEHSYGKTEMWHIIDADEGAGIYIGLNNDYTKEEIKNSLDDGSIINKLNFVKVKKGDTYLIKSGTIHAIGKGVRIIEIQQNSDLTYRLYDYKRKDKDGNYRELHIDKAIQVIDYHKYDIKQNHSNLLADTSFFHVERKEFNKELIVKADKSFVSFTFLEGEGMVDDIPYKKFDTFFLPFNKVCKIQGNGLVIISRV